MVERSELGADGLNGRSTRVSIALGQPGSTQGLLATGTITAANLVGALAGQPLSTLVDSIQGDHAYVNVHTSEFPGGEVRGQIG